MKTTHLNSNKYVLLVCMFLAAVGTFYVPIAVAAEMQFAVENPAPIGPPESTPRERAAQQELSFDFDSPAPLPQNTFEGIDFDENADLTGFFIIPPDPIAAAGPDHIVSVVNSSIEWHGKTGGLQASLNLEDGFFSPL